MKMFSVITQNFKENDNDKSQIVCRLETYDVFSTNHILFMTSLPFDYFLTFWYLGTSMYDVKDVTLNFMPYDLLHPEIGNFKTFIFISNWCMYCTEIYLCMFRCVRNYIYDNPSGYLTNIIELLYCWLHSSLHTLLRSLLQSQSLPTSIHESMRKALTKATTIIK